MSKSLRFHKDGSNLLLYKRRRCQAGAS